MTQEEFEGKVKAIFDSNQQSSVMLSGIKDTMEQFTKTIVKENDELKNSKVEWDKEKEEFTKKIESQETMIKRYRDNEKNEFLSELVDNNRILATEKEYFSKKCDELGIDTFKEIASKFVIQENNLTDQKIAYPEQNANNFGRKLTFSAQGKSYTFDNEIDLIDFKTMITTEKAENAYQIIYPKKTEGGA